MRQNLKVTDVNMELSSLHGGSFEIIPTVPLTLQFRLMFHSATKEHIPPANLKKGDGWRYQGTRADLVSYAENIQPEGTFQPWLNVNWG